MALCPLLRFTETGARNHNTKRVNRGKSSSTMERQLQVRVQEHYIKVRLTASTNESASSKVWGCSAMLIHLAAQCGRMHESSPVHVTIFLPGLLQAPWLATIADRGRRSVSLLGLLRGEHPSATSSERSTCPSTAFEPQPTAVSIFTTTSATHMQQLSFEGSPLPSESSVGQGDETAR